MGKEKKAAGVEIKVERYYYYYYCCCALIS